jgi:hypothetical protein
MTSSFRALLACVLLFAATAARTVFAQDTTATVIDHGRFIVLDRGRPVGSEEFQYTRQADSITVVAGHVRTLRDSTGAVKKWVKNCSLVVDAQDFGLRRYTSNQLFDTHEIVRGILPGDTAMTVYSEYDGAGGADLMSQPPGRLFIVDPPMFTLMDVICRNVSAHELEKRPVEMIALGEATHAVEGMAIAAGPDTIRWGGRRMVSRRYVLQDDEVTLFAWVSPSGQLLRLVHEASGLEVLREEPKPPVKPMAKPATKARPRPR